MPSRLKLRLAPEAEDDLAHILHHSVNTWGLGQARSYKATLYRALRRLCQYPYIGRAREEIGPGIRSLPVDQHIVLYRVSTVAIEVARIMHSRQDWLPHNEEPGDEVEQ